MDYYKILGLTSQASQNEIKRAYFRLLRQHSPETDPEGFRQIREAYEYLKAAQNEEEGPLFPPFKEPFAQRFADQIMSEFRRGNFTLARDTAKEAWKHFPDEIFFLYWLVKAQRRCGNTGNAAKNAELLVKKDPGNKWFWGEYGISLMIRGFEKKAYEPLSKAYEMGIRELNFILFFSQDCMDCGRIGKAMEILLEVIRRDNKWQRDNLPDLLEVFNFLFEIYSDYTDYDYTEEIFLRLCSVMREYRSLLREQPEEWLELLHCFFSSEFFQMNRERYAALTKTLNSLKPVLRDPEDSNQVEIMQKDALTCALRDDPRICNSLVYMSELELNMDVITEPAIRRFADMDTKLCMIEQREQILAVMDVLRDEYPEFYENNKDFFDSIKDEASASSLKARLLPLYAKGHENISGGRYFELYPKEKNKFYGTPIATGEATYERAHKKIGRNDPCPCGSGKKFKKCCMGKHIYD